MLRFDMILLLTSAEGLHAFLRGARCARYATLRYAFAICRFIICYAADYAPYAAVCRYA